MKEKKFRRLLNKIFTISILCTVLLSGCGEKESIGNSEMYGLKNNSSTVKSETVETAETVMLVENQIESIFGTWYIENTNATLWFNELGYEYEVPSSDYTVNGYNLYTMQHESGKTNYSYSVKEGIITFDTYNGGVSYSYQSYDDGSVILANTDNGDVITLTREMGVSGSTVTEMIGGHKYGHRMGNETWDPSDISYGSVLAWEGGIVYYTDPGDGNHLYYCNEDGSNRTLMSKLHTQDINIMDGWVYFSGYDEANREKTTGAYKMKLDGTQLHMLDDLGYARSLSIVDDTLYYTGLTTEGNYLYQSDLDGKNPKKINTEPYGDSLIVFSIYGDYAYFVDSDNGGHTLMRMSLSDGNIETVVSKLSSTYYQLDKDGIFVVRSQDIYHYDLNGGSEAKLIDCYTDYVIETGGYLIYYGGSNVRGTEMVSIMDLQNPTTILNYGGKVCYTDNYLYYYKDGEITVTAYR